MKGMSRSRGPTRFVVTLAFTLAAVAGVAFRLSAQNASPADAAAKLSGHWALNAELTPASKPQGGRGQAAFAIAGATRQRGGGRRGGGSDTGGGGGTDASSPLMPEEVAAQAALSILHEVPKELTIEATADTITFREPRGEWHFKIDGKNGPMEVPGGAIHSKSKWDKGTLRQEFSSAQRKLVKSWSLDGNDRLVLVEKVESMALNSESRAVFDRQ